MLFYHAGDSKMCIRDRYKDATYAELYDTLAAGMPGNGQQVYEDENSGIYG